MWRRMGPGGPTGLQNRVAWRNAARMVRLHPFSATSLSLGAMKAGLRLAPTAIAARVLLPRRSRAGPRGMRHRVCVRESADQTRENARRFSLPRTVGDEW